MRHLFTIIFLCSIVHAGAPVDADISESGCDPKGCPAYEELSLSAKSSHEPERNSTKPERNSTQPAGNKTKPEMNNNIPHGSEDDEVNPMSRD